MLQRGEEKVVEMVEIAVRVCVNEGITFSSAASAVMELPSEHTSAPQSAGHAAH